MPVRKRPDTGAWEAIVCWGGRTIRRSSARWSREQARAVERKILDDIHALETGGKPRRLISEAVERWMLEYVPRLKSNYAIASQVSALLPFIRGRALSEIPDVAEEVKAAWSELKPATINRRLAILRRVGNLACDVWRWIDEPVGRRVKLLRENNQRHFYMTTEQVEIVARHCTNPHAADLIRLAAYTGIRTGHMMRLTRHDVVGDTLRLDSSGKGGRPMNLPLHPSVQSIAERLPLPISKPALRKQWEAARVAAGMPEFHWHDLRHTCASWLVQAGVPLLVVKEILQHATMQTTIRYAHLADENRREAIRRLA